MTPTPKTEAVEFTSEERQQALSALQMWDKHLRDVAGVLPANMPGLNATSSAYAKLLATHLKTGAAA
jgi:hypothetical protein